MDLGKKGVHRDSPGHRRRTFFCCRDGAGRSESPAASRCHAGCRHWNRRCECSNSCYPGASCHLPHPGAHPACTVKQSEAGQPAHNGRPILAWGSLPACSLPRAPPVAKQGLNNADYNHTFPRHLQSAGFASGLKDLPSNFAACTALKENWGWQP